MSIHIGLQLYSVRKELAKAPADTLKRVSELGFRYLEAANHTAETDDGIGFGVPAAELRAMLSDLGLQVISTHVSTLDENRLSAILDYQQAIGSKHIACDIEFYPHGDRDYVLRRAEVNNRAGRLCAERGMQFLYHNHYQEFQEIDGTPVYQILLDNTDPDLVFVEMDTYWVYRGGHNPIEWMRRYPERVMMLHQKDFPASAPQPLNIYDGVVDKDSEITYDRFMQVENPLCFTEIGTGTLPIQEILDSAATLPNLECVFLEQDYTQLPELDSLARSREAFGAYRGIDWA